MNDYIMLLIVTVVFGALLGWFAKRLTDCEGKISELAERNEAYERAFVQNDERFAAMSQRIVEIDRRVTELSVKFGAAEELISNAAELSEIQANTERLMQQGLQSIMNYDVYEARKDK